MRIAVSEGRLRSASTASDEARQASTPWPRPSATRKVAPSPRSSTPQESPFSVSPFFGTLTTPIS